VGGSDEVLDALGVRVAILAMMMSSSFGGSDLVRLFLLCCYIFIDGT
jgi:hypothetical protein